MPKLSNGCQTVNGGRLIKQQKFPSLSPELEILAPDISGHQSFIIAAYLPRNEGKCRKVAYLTSGNHQIQVEFYDSLDSLHPYRRQTYTPMTIPPKHLQYGKEILQAYQVMLPMYMSR